MNCATLIQLLVVCSTIADPPATPPASPAEPGKAATALPPLNPEGRTDAETARSIVQQVLAQYRGLKSY